MISPTHPRLIPRAAGRTGRPFAAVLSVLVAALALLCAFAPASPAAPLEQKLSITGAPGVLFGYSAAVDGDTLVVGDPLAGRDVGAVYVFQRSGGSWTNTAKLTASDGSTGDLLGVSVAIRGDTIVAGATGDGIDRTVTNEGAVYTFARTGAPDRTQTAKLTASDGAKGASLGQSVGIDGDTIVAGAPGKSVGTHALQGAVLTFARTGGPARTQTATLTASDGAAADRLGYSVAIHGDTILAGAPDDDSASVFVLPPSAPPAAAAPAPAPASAAAPPLAVKPALSRLAVKPKTIHRAAAASSTAAKRARITFTLSAAASVELRFQRVQAGRAVGGRCAKPSRANRSRPRCTRYVTVGRFTVQGRAGANAVPFTGRRSARSRFPVGHYRLIATPTDGSGNAGTPRTTTLAIANH